VNPNDWRVELSAHKSLRTGGRWELWSTTSDRGPLWHLVVLEGRLRNDGTASLELDLDELRALLYGCARTMCQAILDRDASVDPDAYELLSQEVQPPENDGQ